MTMHKIAFISACLASLGHARRVFQRPQQAKVAEAATNPSQREMQSDLAKLLLAFNPAGPMVKPMQNVVGNRPVKSMNRNVQEAAHLNTPSFDVRREGSGPVMVENRNDYSTILLIGSLLAGISGFVNIIAFLEIGLPITHHTGTASHFGRLFGQAGSSFGELSGFVAFKLGLLMAAYSAGAATAAYSKVDGEAVFRGKRCIQLLVAAAFIAIGAPLRTFSTTLTLLAWSFSQGMMNAVTSVFPSGPIRVTHVSGTLTDLGLGVGNWVRAGVTKQVLPSLKKPLFLACQVLTFVLGGVIATMMHAPFGVEAVWAPAIALAILGFGRAS